MNELILKISGKDFYKGLSLYSQDPVGGIFKLATNYDPFLKLGRLYPTLGPTRKDGSSIAIPIRSFEFYSDGTNRFLFAFGNKDISDKSAYKINLDTDAITDISSGVHTNVSAGTTQLSSTVRLWQGRIVYSQDDSGASLRSITPSATGDVSILGSLASGDPSHPSVIGPDGHLYVGNAQYIARCVIATGTSGNSATQFDSLQSNLVCRDLDHDGQFIFAGFDNNTAKLSGIKADCQIIVWDRYKAYAEKRYQLSESYIIAVKCLGSACYVLTPSGWYVCSIASEPKLLYPMSSDSPINVFPTDFNGVAKNGHSIYWIDSAGTGYVFAFGQKIAGRPNILYQPYYGIGTAENMQALAISSSYIYTGTSINRIYKLNFATGSSASIQTCPHYLPQPYTFAYTKLKLRTVFQSGDSITHGLYNSNSEVISDNETKTYTTEGSRGLKTILFRRTATTNSVVDFTDLYPFITTNAEIAEIEVYGDKMSIHSQQT